MQKEGVGQWRGFQKHTTHSRTECTGTGNPKLQQPARRARGHRIFGKSDQDGSAAEDSTSEVLRLPLASAFAAFFCVQKVALPEDTPSAFDNQCARGKATLGVTAFICG